MPVQLITLIIELIICTAGSILYLFLLTLFAGLRQRRVLEVILFQTGISVFLIFSGRLLELNAQISGAHYPFALQLGKVLFTAGAYFFPPLLVHTHIEYWRRRDQNVPGYLSGLSAVFYFGIALSLGCVALAAGGVLPSLAPIAVRITPLLPLWLPAALVVSVGFQIRFARCSAEATLRRLHFAFAIFLSALAVLSLVPGAASWPFLLVLLFPGAFLGYYFIRQRFLPFGVQRSLVYTVSAGFLALLYLTLVQRISEWLEPAIPGVATRSILIFLLVLFFVPIERVFSSYLDRAFRQQTVQLQRLAAEILNVARDGDLGRLLDFAESRIRGSLGLASVRIFVEDAPPRPPLPASARKEFRLPLSVGEQEVGSMTVASAGLSLSGGLIAALEYLAEHLPEAVDLCRLLNEKLALQRSLAERERLAQMGEMTARISHNLRNPLSSIKTLLQLQRENPELPASARSEIEMVLSEVERLTATLNQILEHARLVTEKGTVVQGTVDVAAHANRAVALRQPIAERQGISLTFRSAAESCMVQGREAALDAVLSNLIGNALEAVSAGGHIFVSVERRDTETTLLVEDDGPGVPPDLRNDIFRAFFTTKARGTGLGLSIVESRVREMGGTITCDSPARNGHGTRFVVSLRSA
jgi:signal transduction histidine kinase